MARLLDKLVGNHERLDPLLEAQKKNRLASTLLFAGPSGVGKKLAALSLAQSLICEREVAGGCGECGPCIRIEKGQSESLMMIEPEGVSIKIEQSRDALQFISLRKTGRARVVIIDQAHTLNPQAANALLKSLEEPPDGTYFILITGLAASILPTIRSRSQLVRFRSLTTPELAKVLGPDADPWVLEAAQGSVENALRLSESRADYQELEDALIAYLGAATVRFPSDEVSRLRELLKERTAQGFVASSLQAIFRDALRLQGGLPALARGESRLAEWAAQFAPRTLGELTDRALEMEHDMARNFDRGLWLETFAIRWRDAATPAQ